MFTWNFRFEFPAERKCTPYLSAMQRSGQVLVCKAFPAGAANLKILSFRGTLRAEESLFLSLFHDSQFQRDSSVAAATSE